MKNADLFNRSAWLFSCLLCFQVNAEQTDNIAANEVRAQLTARYSTILSAEISAAIKQLTIREGESFKKGDLLVVFDCAIQQAQLQKAQATANGATKTFQVNSRLSELDSVSTLDVEVAKAKLGEANADIALMQASLNKCRIQAPFSGRVVSLPAHQHQYLKIGDPIMDIIDGSQLELKLIVPSVWLRWLKTGQTFQVHIDELNQVFPAQIDSIGASIDPVSQTVPVVGQIKGKHRELLTGMSGKAIFADAVK
ncbi:MAG: efflux RND transporter periplasmic adaptor subunit [Methylomicrobium sp.]|nr:efflux RND transporter periplasmic adaptor subunit [Methylomicrobium sp.]